MTRVYDFIFRHAAEGIIIVDENGIILHMNPAAVSMTKISLENSLGHPVSEAFAAYPALVRLFKTTGTEQLDVRLPQNRLATGIAQFVQGGRAALLNDVTEQRDLESRREALVKRIAHDLRNPINALGGYANLVARSGELNELQIKFNQRIQQTTNKLYEMAGKLVDLAWIEAGMPLQHVSVELIRLTHAVIQELSYEAHQKNITLINSIPNELPPVIGDPHRLKQTLFNILDNAIRYSHEGSNVVIHAWHQEDQVMCAIADQGIGIMPGEIDKIWDRMWRSNDERVRNISGGGIGLSFAQIIIQRHGGSITAESEYNIGTTITFSLPLTRGA